MDAATARRLAERTLALVDIPRSAGTRPQSPSWSPRRCRGARSARSTRTARGSSTRRARTAGRPFVLLAGHLDTIPAQDNLPGRIENGWVVGLGATDMKGGLAVMLELAELARRGPSRAAARRRPPLLHAGGAAGRREPPAGACSRGARSCARRISPSCSSRRTTRSRPGASATSTRRSRFTVRLPTRPAPGRGRTRSPPRSRGSSRSRGYRPSRSTSRA